MIKKRIIGSFVDTDCTVQEAAIFIKRMLMVVRSFRDDTIMKS